MLIVEILSYLMLFVSCFLSLVLKAIGFSAVPPIEFAVHLLSVIVSFLVVGRFIGQFLKNKDTAQLPPLNKFEKELVAFARQRFLTQGYLSNGSFELAEVAKLHNVSTSRAQLALRNLVARNILVENIRHSSMFYSMPILDQFLLIQQYGLLDEWHDSRDVLRPIKNLITENKFLNNKIELKLIKS